MNKSQQKHRLNWRKIGLAVLILSPIALLVAALARYSVNVPFWDQWELVTIFEKSVNGTLGFADFFAQHNEHRILFPRLIMFTLATLTHWNTLYEVATNVILACGIFGVFYVLLRRTFVSKKLLYAVTFFVSLILFSPDQFENWMWGWQLQWFANVLGLVVAVWALSSWKPKKAPAFRLAFAILAAVFATYSLASGLFVWIVCLPLLWFSKDLKKYMYVWIVAGLITIWVHYIGYVDPAYHPSKLLFLQQPLEFVKYFLVYMGRPLAIDFSLALATAVGYMGIIIAGFIFIFKRYAGQLATPLLPWIAIGLYAIFAGLSTDISRLGFGVEQAYSSRYITLSCLLLIAICVISFKIIELANLDRERTQQIAKKTAIIFMSAVFVLVGVNYYKGLRQMKDRHEYLLTVRECARTATGPEDSCLLKLYPNKEVVWPRLQFLRSIHWGGL
jgi:hypothetical protein